MFIIDLTYIKPMGEVEKYLVEHRAYLDRHYESNNFICSGRKNPTTGGIILCNAKDIKEVEKIIDEDPFKVNEIAAYSVLEFNPTKYAEKFKSFVE
ncbi:MAG: YciI family protein [Solirubrobacterales bacterium]